jgi:hypothetical protein
MFILIPYDNHVNVYVELFYLFIGLIYFIMFLL